MATSNPWWYSNCLSSSCLRITDQQYDSPCNSVYSLSTNVFPCNGSQEYMHSEDCQIKLLFKIPEETNHLMNVQMWTGIGAHHCVTTDTCVSCIFLGNYTSLTNTESWEIGGSVR